MKVGSFQSLLNLARRISERMDLVAPRRVGDDLFLDFIENPEEIELGRTTNSPKEFLLPQRETLFVLGKETPKPKGVALFGIRPCEFRALLALSRVMLDDPLFESRWRGSIFVVQACTEPCESGFCGDLGGPFFTDEDPYFEWGKPDIQFYVLRDRVFFEAFTKRGKELLSETEGLVEASGELISSLMGRIEEVRRDMRRVKVQGVEKRMRWDHPVFSYFADRCIECGGCNFECPSCFCFDVHDSNDGTWTREREWDSCLLEGFSRMALGSNPRKDESSRMRQRIMHKFSYFKERYGLYMCTGCGRCLEACPSGIDLREVIEWLWRE